MEASLLPSPEFKELARTVRLAAVGKGDEAGAVRKEFGLLARAPSFFVVLDAKGGWLGLFTGDEAGSACSKEGVAKFPGLVLRKLQECLGRPHSLQDLERVWTKEKSAPDLAALTDRLKEHKQFTRLAELYEGLTASPPTLLEALRFRASANYPRSVEATRRFLELGRRLLTDYPESDEARKAVSLVWSPGLSNGFDVPAKSDAFIRSLEARADGAAGPALRERVAELRKLRSDFIRRNEASAERLRASGASARSLDFILSLLGDAEAAIRHYSQSGAPAGGNASGASANGNAFSAGTADPHGYGKAQIEEARTKLAAPKKDPSGR